MLVFASCFEHEFICRDIPETCVDHEIQIDDSKKNRKVLIIGIDGFRPDAMRADISPFLYQLSERSNTYYTDRQQVEALTSSGPNWSSLLTGVHCKHQVSTSDFTNNRLEEFPHFYKYIEEADSSMSTASIVHWGPINEFIASNHTDYMSGGEDQQIYQQGKEMLLNQDPINPDILFLHFVDLDAAGHVYGFHPEIPEYANTLSRIDEYISDFVSIIDIKRADGEDWLIFVVSDHGGDGVGHHNYRNVNIRFTVFFANHPEVQFLTSYTSTQADLAPTVLDFMGITSEEFNCKTDGISIIDGL
jgi:predicted AlkP superfamily pyrophosphatase or phosphodiesterase